MHKRVIFLNPGEFTEAYSKPCPASKMEYFAKIVNDFLIFDVPV